MNFVSKLGLAACCSLAVVSVGMAQSGPLNPQQQAQAAVKLRQSVFDVQNFSFGPMAAMLKGGPFNAAAAVQAGQRIEMTSSMIPEVFKLDTTKFSVKTRALPRIWPNMADFTQKAQNLHDAAAGLVTAAKTGDQQMTMQAAIQVGKACGSCHDEYRLK
ncbi:MAG: c-type cytochrome [Steroidobacteraceae bacterium]